MTTVAGSAAQASAAAPCPNAAIRAEQHVEGLPGCRALEMVSPPDKGGGSTFPQAIGDTGDRMVFMAATAFAGSPSSNNGRNFYRADRTVDGWTTQPINVPAALAASPSDGFASPLLPADLSWALWLNETQEQNANGGAGFYKVSPTGALQIGTIQPLAPTPHVGYYAMAASTDLRHVVFRAASRDVQLTGDEGQIQIGAPGLNLWEVTGLDTETVGYRLINRDDAGNPLGGAGGGCGATLGGLGTSGTSNTTAEHAVSADGQTIYFSAVVGACSGSGQGPRRVYARIGGQRTIELSQSECDRVVPDPNPQNVTACDVGDGSDAYMGASADGNRAFLLSPRQLASSDTDTGQDLYLYDRSRAEGRRLVQISRGDGQSGTTDGNGADVEGMVRISDDGSRVYFVAKGVLTTTPNARQQTAVTGAYNLYVWRQDASHPDGTVAFVGPLDPRDSGRTTPSSDPHLWDLNDTHRAYAVPRYGPQGPPSGGDGHILIFVSYAQLTADDHDDAMDVYRYDDQNGSLVRVSIGASGAEPDAGNDDVDATMARPQNPSFPQRVQAGRPATEDGQKVVFTTAEPLTSDDVNDVPDAYLWRNGQVDRMSVGTADSGVLNNAWTTPSGRVVSFMTADPLLPQDLDHTGDVYVARVNGGFPLPPELRQTPCTGEACQNPPPLPPALAPSVTQLFRGPGNVPPSPPPPPVTPVAVTVKKPKHTARGTRSMVRVTVSGKGKIRTSGSGLRRTYKTVGKKGSYRVAVRLSKRSRHILKRKNRVRVRVSVRFTPDVGRRKTARVRVTFRTKGRRSAHRSAPQRVVDGAAR